MKRSSLILWSIINLFMRALWRIRIRGEHHLPQHGGVLACANHQSLLDGAVLGLALNRPAIFITYAKYVEVPVLGPLMRLAGCVAIDEKGSRRALAGTIATATEQAAAGGVVGIFPEGKLTRSGQTDRFQGGCERIAQRANVPMLPVAIDGLWGARLWLSHRPARHWLPRFRPSIDVVIGEPLPPTASAGEVRAATQRLLHDIAVERSRRDQRSLAEATLRGLRRRAWTVAVSDANGALTGCTLAGVAESLRRRLRLADDERAVGILLPPGRGGTAANLAVLWDGRTVVNLNHTAGEARLRRMCELAGVRTIITSRIYRHRISLPSLPARLIDLEDVLPAIPKLELLLRGVVRLASAAPRVDPDAVAALVFTSGSTGDPKGVELTHRQVLANLDAIGNALEISRSDVLVNPLPLFHSFGLVPGMLLGICQGIAIAGQADPNDGAALGMLIERSKGTVLLGTATFARTWMRRIEPAQAKRLRLTVVGAEKCPADLRKTWKERYASPLLEGYGCTELCPVASVNVPAVTRGGMTDDGTREGSVGRPLPGIHVAAVDLSTGRELPPGEEGMLVVWSAARMRGYLGRADLTAASMLREGYRTGDRGRVDADGFIFITGRLSRFAKIAGEMVPLDSVQEALQGAVAASGSEAEIAVAAVADPGKGEKLVVLHTGFSGDWEALIAGLPIAALWKPRTRDVRAVAALPKLGTGKLDLAALAALAGTASST